MTVAQGIQTIQETCAAIGSQDMAGAQRLPVSTIGMLVRYGAEVDAVSSDGISVAQRATRTQKQLIG